MVLCRYGSRTEEQSGESSAGRVCHLLATTAAAAAAA